MKLSIAKALGLTAALTASGLAQATTIATAYLNVDNAMFQDNGGTILSAGLFAFSNLQNNTVVSTGLGAFGSSPVTSGGSQTKTATDILAGSGGLDAYSAKGSGAPANNVFTTPLPNPAVNEYAVSDTQLIGGLLNFGQGQSGAYADTYDSVSLTGSSTGSADAVIGSTSILQFTSLTNLSGNFTFTLSDYLKVWIDPLMTANSTATAKGSFSVSLTDKTTGATFNQSAFTLGNLQYNIGGDSSGFTTYGGGLQSLFNTEIVDTNVAKSLAFSLIAGHTYDFKLSQDTYANATNVPEPGSLALMGLGLLGFSVLRKNALNA